MWYIIVMLVFAFFCAATAQKKGRNQFLWFILGALFTIIATIIIVKADTGLDAAGIEEE